MANPTNIKIICSGWLIGICLLVTGLVMAQETNTVITGRVVTDRNQPLEGATVTVTHEPTRNLYHAISGTGGVFRIFNLKPGGPYSIEVSLVGFVRKKKENIQLSLGRDLYMPGGDDSAFIFQMQPNELSLEQVLVNGRPNEKLLLGLETNISGKLMGQLPTVSRNMQDYLRMVPQANIRADGAISLAGQNNRFNAFFVDGAYSNDLLGLAASGTNGGQTGAGPLSVESLDEINVMLSPFHVQYSNFTGGSIHAVTRSGTNQSKAAAWYFFRNQDMAGRSPVPEAKPDDPGKTHRPRLPDFFNQTFGAWASGPVAKNKLFYFFLLERQMDTRPIQFDMSSYRGNSRDTSLDRLGDFVRGLYGYEPGSYRDKVEKLDVKRVSLKLDWNPSAFAKFMVSYRLNDATRTGPRAPNTATSVSFENSGFILPSTTHTASLEWKQYAKKAANNRLLIGYTSQLEDRQWIGEPFPRVLIRDGLGTIILGADPPSSLTRFEAREWTLFDVFTLERKNHVITAGFDAAVADLEDTYINAYFGNYQYASLNDFTNESFPFRYIHSYSLLDTPRSDHTLAGARFRSVRAAVFLQDDWRIGKNFSITAGIRVDRLSVPASITADAFFNDSALPVISGYHDLQGARSGELMQPQWPVSPRAGFTWSIPKARMTLRGGVGIFSGHVVNTWFSAASFQGVGSIDLNPRNYGLRFEPDPYAQPGPARFGLDESTAKGDLVLVAKGFRFPMVFRSSMDMGLSLPDNWSVSVQGLWSVNIHETNFRNVNIMPPIGVSTAPGSRNVYSVGNSPFLIPVRSDGSNPYTGITLMSNAKGKKGYAGSVSAIVGKQTNSLSFSASYTVGLSRLYFEITGTNTPPIQQWISLETVQGRNNPTLSVSDNDLRHRVTGMFSKRITWAGGKAMTMISAFYNGQSGSPYSFTIDGSIVNDNGSREGLDLAYIPTSADLASMQFIPVNTPQGSYSPGEQRLILDRFIESEPYLRNNRGNFAARNGARTPFTHSLDIRLQQDFCAGLKNRKFRISVIWDVFNFLNLLNPDWGRQFVVSGDNFKLFRFAGYANASTMTPMYQFFPYEGRPYSVTGSTAPGSSARWISQLGFRLSWE